MDLNNVYKSGGKAYLVGGAVRNLLLDEKIKDLDLIISGLSENKFKKLFPEAKKVGTNFKVFLLKDRKKDIKYEINLISEKQLLNDLFRRDFTINSIAIELKELKLIDPCNGLSDLIQGRLQIPDINSFKADPLRIYRAFRLAIRYNLKISEETIDYMLLDAQKIQDIYPERVFEELKKIILLDGASQFFWLLKEFDLLKYHFPELKQLIDVEQPVKYHPEGDAFTHTMLAFDKIVRLTSKPDFTDEKKFMLRYAILVHDIGKSATPAEEYPHHYDHEDYGLAILDVIKNRKDYILPEKVYRAARLVIRHHMRVYHFNKMNPGKVVNLFEDIKRSPLSIEEFALIIIADDQGRDYNKKIPAYISEMIKLYHKMYANTSGNDIDLQKYQGYKVGEQLFQLRCKFIKEARED
ncbi:MAG: CCA tRNA nucleotidyltransferase [Bacillota bacterium]